MNNSAPSVQSHNLTTTEVTSALNAILNTDKFMASPQMSAFLRYVVEQTLIGNTRRIKAFTVGIEALGKPASFDPQTDPSVRVLAKRLRSSLDTYYAQNPQVDVFIEMKPGSYVPKFLHRNKMPIDAPTDSITNATPAQSSNATSAAESTAHNSAVADMAETMAQPVYEPQDIDEQSMSQTAGQVSSAHLSVKQQNKLTAHHAESPADAVESDERADRKSSISQLWQAYKSTSKVA